MKQLILVFLCAFLTLQFPCQTMAGNNTERLIDLGNGIIKDSHTGLMWQQGKSRKSFTSEDDARHYAATLDLGGFTDWRLPTLAERWDILQVFVYKNNGSVEFPKMSYRYWTSESDEGTIPIKLDITCLCRGDEDVEYKSKGKVRAVRP